MTQTQTQPVSITEMVRDLEAERDGLAQRVADLTARCVAQELVIARVRSLRAALDEYAAEHGDRAAADPAPPTHTEICAWNAEIAMPEPAAPTAHGRRYTEDAAREWLADLQAGRTCTDVWRDRGVAADTVRRRVTRLLPEAEFRHGRLVVSSPQRTTPTPLADLPTCAARGRWTEVQALEAGERMRAGLTPQEAAAHFGVSVEQLQAGLRGLEMDPETGQYTHRPPEEELLREPAFAAEDCEVDAIIDSAAQ